MAPNKFASALHRNTNRLTLVLVYVLLEWILIAMILLNSLFSYLIVKFTDYFGLKRPCVLCSRIDHGKDKRVRKDMICEEHAWEISELRFCRIHQKLVNCSQVRQNCSASSSYEIEKESRFCCCGERLEEKPALLVLVENREVHFFDHEKQSVEQETDGVAEEVMHQLVSVKLGMSGDDVDEDLRAFLDSESDPDSAPAPDTKSEGENFETVGAPVAADTHDDRQDLNGSDHESEDSSEHSEIIMEIADHQKARKLSRNRVEEESDFEAESETEQPEVSLSPLNERSYQYTSTINKLTRALNEVRAELHQERSDAADASSQTMEIITKLQEENTALQLEASKRQQMTEMPIAFDNEAVLPLDESNLEIKLDIEQPPNDLNAASTIEKLTMALNEAYAELEQERNDYAEISSQTMAMITKIQEEKATLQLEASQYQRMTEEQIAFDEEAVLLLDEMLRRREKENHELEKELEFYKKQQENMKRSEEDHLHHRQQNVALASESVSVCCSSFGDQDSDGVPTENYDDHQHHVDHHGEQPFVDSEDERLSIFERLNELEQKLVEDSDTVVEDEEEDMEFLRRCIKTVNKDDEGMSLVQEILQHLRALRRVDIILS